ncbi:MAG: polymer-forming cytoskeletal protein [Gemmatimonadota bacterium]
MGNLVGQRRGSHRMRVRPALAVLSFLAVSVWGIPAPLLAQDVRLSPADGDAQHQRLSEFLSRPPRHIWARDTLLGSDQTVPGHLLILQASVRIAGRVEGDIFVVDGDLFLRPGASVGGDIVVLGGGFFGSRLAAVEGEVDDRPLARYEVLPEAGGYHIYPAAPRLPDSFRPHGLSGIKLPAYQRVNGWILEAGATAQAVRTPWQPSLEGVVRYRTTQADFGASARQMWHPTPYFRFGLEAGVRETAHQQRWLRSDFTNTVSYLAVGDDFRNYYEADRVALVLEWPQAERWGGKIVVQREDAMSLAATEHTVVFGSDSPRSNPAIDDGVIWSVKATGRSKHSGRAGTLATVAELEVADSTAGGMASYALASFRARWEAPGPGEHRIELLGMARGDISGVLPRQRWTGFGGRGTMPTFSPLAFLGPRMVYGQATYMVPLTGEDVGPLGMPYAFVREVFGAAWEPGDSADFEHNLLVGLRVAGLELALALDPSVDDLDPIVVFTLATPSLH